MVGENTVGMKKLEEITLEDIQNYLRKYDCDGVITTKLVEKNNTETLQVFEFDGLYDDTIWVCSIYKNEDNDFYIKTANATSPFNHADGVEYDDEEKDFEQIDENTFMIDGSVSIYDLRKILGVDIPEGDYDTLSGYLIELLGRIPQDNEKPVIETEKVTYKIEEYEEKRILWVKACKNKTLDDKDENEEEEEDE